MYLFLYAYRIDTNKKRYQVPICKTDHPYNDHTDANNFPHIKRICSSSTGNNRKILPPKMHQLKLVPFPCGKAHLPLRTGKSLLASNRQQTNVTSVWKLQEN